MDDQGGAGGVPLHGEDDDRQHHRKPHVEQLKPEQELGPVRKEDTDEASRLDHPQSQDPDEPRKHRTHGKGPDEF